MANNTFTPRTNGKTPNGKLMWVKLDEADKFGKISAQVELSEADALAFNKQFEDALLSVRNNEATTKGIDASLIEVVYPAKIGEGGVYTFSASTAKTFTTKEYTKKDGTVVPSVTKENVPFTIDGDGKDLVLNGIKIGNGSVGNICFSWKEASVKVNEKTYKPYVSIAMRLEGIQVIDIIPYGTVKQQDPRELYKK